MPTPSNPNVANNPPDMYADVLAFHERFGCTIGAFPHWPFREVVALRIRLMQEELTETIVAMTLGDIPAVADGLADLIYVALGTAITYGIDLREVWEEVHAANMRKEGGAVREDGKILKPEGWVPPNIKDVLDKQRLAWAKK